MIVSANLPNYQLTWVFSRPLASAPWSNEYLIKENTYLGGVEAKTPAHQGSVSRVARSGAGGGPRALGCLGVGVVGGEMGQELGSSDLWAEL